MRGRDSGLPFSLCSRVLTLQNFTGMSFPCWPGYSLEAEHITLPNSLEYDQRESGRGWGEQTELGIHTHNVHITPPTYGLKISWLNLLYYPESWLCAFQLKHFNNVRNQYASDYSFFF